jgi:hypothetical protein
VETDVPFPGFASPNYTQIPDELIDVLMPRLSEAELKVLLYICRRTFGFGKEADTISIRQMVEGITARDGRRLDAGTGLSKAGVTKALASLRAKGIILATRHTSPEYGHTATTYRLRLLGEPLGTTDAGAPPPPVASAGDKPLYTGVDKPLSATVDTQETVVQETVEQERGFEISKGPPADFGFGPERDAILDYLADFARELGDTAPLSASVTRAARLYRRSGLGLEAFVAALYAARAKTKERTAAIRAQPIADGRAIPLKPKMAYFFAVLEDLVQRRDESAD